MKLKLCCSILRTGVDFQTFSLENCHPCGVLWSIDDLSLQITSYLPQQQQLEQKTRGATDNSDTVWFKIFWSDDYCLPINNMKLGNNSHQPASQKRIDHTPASRIEPTTSKDKPGLTKSRSLLYRLLLIPRKKYRESNRSSAYCSHFWRNIEKPGGEVA